VHVRSTQRSVLDELVVECIRETLQRTRGNVRRTAMELRVPYRTMWKRIKTLGLRDELEYFRRVRVLRLK
jgi:transcriptional regulator of acetoin/glycerol metabolism